MIEQLLQWALPAVGSILMGVGAWLGVQVVAWVRVKTKSDQAAQLVGEVRLGAGDAVAWVAAQMKAGILEAARDGSVSPAEAQRLQELAIAKLREWLGANFPQRAETLLGIGAPLLQEWLRGVIQRQFEDTKAQAPLL